MGSGRTRRRFDELAATGGLRAIVVVLVSEAVFHRRFADGNAGDPYNQTATPVTQEVAGSGASTDTARCRALSYVMKVSRLRDQWSYLLLMRGDRAISGFYNIN